MMRFHIATLQKLRIDAAFPEHVVNHGSDAGQRCYGAAHVELGKPRTTCRCPIEPSLVFLESA